MTTNDNQGASRYGQQEQAYSQPAYQQGYGQQPTPYGQVAPAAYGQQYPAPATGYGQSVPVPSRPGGVTTAAVFGIIFGVLGVIATFALIILGAIAGGAASSANDAVPGLGSLAGAAAGALIVLGILALAWTVLVIMGSVWSLSGRSRVLLIVMGSISILTTGFSLIASLGNDPKSASSIIISLVLFAMSIAIVVLLSRGDATRYFNARRMSRTGR